MPLAILCRDCSNYKKDQGFTYSIDPIFHWCTVLLRHFCEDFGCIRGVSKNPLFALEVEIPPTDSEGICSSDCALSRPHTTGQSIKAYKLYCELDLSDNEIPGPKCPRHKKEKSNA